MKESKMSAASNLEDELNRWAYVNCDEKKNYKDIRTLLATLEEVLWVESGWQPISMAQLVISDNAVKRAYMSAIRLAHPDKAPRDSPEIHARADRIFTALNEAFRASK